MAVVDIKLAPVVNRSIYNSPAPAIDAEYTDTDYITTSGTSQVADFSTPADSSGFFWVITVLNGNIRAKFGVGTPVAAANEDGGWLILEGQTRIFTAKANQTVAVISQP